MNRPYLPPNPNSWIALNHPERSLGDRAKKYILFGISAHLVIKTSNITIVALTINKKCAGLELSLLLLLFFLAQHKDTPTILQQKDSL